MSIRWLKLTASDIVQLRKLILGINNTFLTIQAGEWWTRSMSYTIRKDPFLTPLLKSIRSNHSIAA
ncbi:MAG: hypothetical protein IPP49_20070 [Saprospiraceae bacterium]|nr:hypothetical protein [Saprospiraceae bacterium]